MRKTRMQFRKVMFSFLLLVIFGVYFTLTQQELISSYFPSLFKTQIELKNVSSMIPSKSSGELHTFTADFEITGPKRFSSKQEVSYLRKSFLNALSNADYDKITSQGNVAYLKSHLSTSVSFSDGSPVENIYVTSLLVDVGMRSESNSSVKKMLNCFHRN